MSRHILVTGGAGFIGSTLVRQLLGEVDCEIWTLDKLTYAGHPANLGPALNDPRHRLIQGDIADRGQVAAILAAFAPETIFHLAAQSHVDRSINDPGIFIATNVVGTFTLLECALEYWRGLDIDRQAGFRFVHVSTDEVFGSLDADGFFHENHPYRPNSPYSASKAGADHLVRAWHQTYGLPTLISNCSNNYGPHQFPEKLIPLIIANALKGMTLPIYGDGQQIRDWLFVDDHVRALRLIGEHGRAGEVYCVGGDAPVSNLDVVRLICALLDEMVPDSIHRPHARLIRHVADRPGHDRRYAMDSRKLREQLGWCPRQDFTTGLRQTIRWYLDNGPWCATMLEAAKAISLKAGRWSGSVPGPQATSFP